MQKVNKALEVIQKIQKYIGNLDDVVNKAKLFDNNLAKIGPLSRAKVMTVLVDYALKMDMIHKEIKSLFAGLEQEAAPLLPLLERIPNFFVEMELIPSFDV